MAAMGSAQMSGTINNNTTIGVSFFSSATTYCVSATVEDNGIGILCSGSGVDPILYGNSMEDNTTGIYCTSSAAGRIQLNTITGGTTGIKCSSSSPGYILWNSVSDATTGVFLDYSASDSLADNSITGNTTGVRFDHSTSGELSNNTIRGSSTGVFALNSGDPDLGDLAYGTGGGNHLDHNTWDVSNATQGLTIMAEDNCWDPSTGPKITGIGSVDTDPEREDCEESLVFTLEGDEERESEPALPTCYALTGARPNPFNPTVTISYDVPLPGGTVTMEVYDVAGRLVTTLIRESRPAGRHTVTWSGQHVASGIYFVRMTAKQFTQTQKIVLLK